MSKFKKGNIASSIYIMLALLFSCSSPARYNCSELKRALSLPVQGRVIALEEIARSCYKDSRIDLAEEAAHLALSEGEKIKGTWNHGNAVFFSNTVLGLVALDRGEQAAAVRFLLSSGKAPPSPQLQTIGPSMILADRLLEQGKIDEVRAFLESIKPMWTSNRERLDNWIFLLEAGRTPDLSLHSWL